MSIVAGVDFGTLSVRVSVFDSARGRLGSGVGEYPLVRKKEDPDHATQSHADHMRALAEAMRGAIQNAGIDGSAIQAIALDTTGSSVIPVDANLNPLDDYYLWCDHRSWKEAGEITSAARAGIWKRSTGAAVSILPNGVSPSSCTGCATIPKSATVLRRRSSIATWLRRCCVALAIRRKRRAASARWATNGCGTRAWAACRQRSS